MAKYYSRKRIIKLLIEKGHKDVELTYMQSEGWWLYSNFWDDWLGSCSHMAYELVLRMKSGCDYKESCYPPKELLPQRKR